MTEGSLRLGFGLRSVHLAAQKSGTLGDICIPLKYECAGFS